MTEDPSPENLRKFLESDDSTIVRMGLSMAKGNEVSDELLGLIVGLYMWHEDKTIRAAAKSAFMKSTSDDAQLSLSILKEVWKPSYRTIAKDVILRPHIDKIFESFKGTLLETVDVWIPAYSRPAIPLSNPWSHDPSIYSILYVLGRIGGERAIRLILKGPEKWKDRDKTILISAVAIQKIEDKSNLVVEILIEP